MGRSPAALKSLRAVENHQSMKSVINRCSRCQTDPRSFLSQCGHRIYSRGTASGNVSGKEGHGRENTSC